MCHCTWHSTQIKVLQNLINLTAIPPPYSLCYQLKRREGIAISVNTDIPEKVLCAAVKTDSKFNVGKIANNEDTPIATDIGNTSN